MPWSEGPVLIAAVVPSQVSPPHHLSHHSLLTLFFLYPPSPLAIAHDTSLQYLRSNLRMVSLGITKTQEQDATHLQKLCSWSWSGHGTDSQEAAALWQWGGRGGGQYAGYCSVALDGSQQFENPNAAHCLHVALMSAGSEYHHALAPGCGHALLVAWLLEGSPHAAL